ncbi:MAG: SDR family oxidoreductase [Pseudomonadales bacterium]|nr:SDR family oxidoreductase [Pseudomonadales bacterium]
MNYLVTGATGFIGRFVVAELLQQSDAKVYALVRKGSEAKLQKIRDQLGVSRENLISLSGNLTAPRLGISVRDAAEVFDKIDHMFHMAAIYDLNASSQAQRKANIEGTRQALLAAEFLKVRCFHHTSSIAAGGLFPGTFTESMFEQATKLDDPYFLSKHLSEALVRKSCRVPYRIYRPSMVVGHSATGEMDKIDGPYYIFQILELVSKILPGWFPMVGLEGGLFNIVPVDYVAKSMVHIAHQSGYDGQCFHLTDSRHYTMGELLTLISAQEKGIPNFKWQIPNKPIRLLLEKAVPLLIRMAWIRRILVSMKVAPNAVNFINYPTRYDRTNTSKALSNSDILLPRFDEYLPALWLFWKNSLSPQRQISKAAIALS